MVVYRCIIAKYLIAKRRFDLNGVQKKQSRTAMMGKRNVSAYWLSLQFAVVQ